MWRGSEWLVVDDESYVDVFVSVFHLQGCYNAGQHVQTEGWQAVEGGEEGWLVVSE